MFFLPKFYKRLEQESSLLMNSGWCEENLQKTDSFLPIYKRKKKKNSF